MAELLFPSRCVLCRKLLRRDETDLCTECRMETDEARISGESLPNLAACTAIWSYEGMVRESILRYKFYGARCYAGAYGRMLAMRIFRDLPEAPEVLTWVPVSRKRRRRRGYDQGELLARAVGRELGMEPVRLLKKVRDNPPQSGIGDDARRRANVLGVYQVLRREQLSGKRILLLDDVITTGATAGECARMLLTAGAKEVSCAAVASARSHTKKP